MKGSCAITGDRITLFWSTPIPDFDIIFIIVGKIIVLLATLYAVKILKNGLVNGKAYSLSGLSS